MFLSKDRREQLFNQSREVHPSLGGLFQNEMEITPEMVDLELAELERHDLATSLLRSQLLILKRNSTSIL